MKKLLILILIFSSPLLAADKNTYYCNETKNIFIDTKNDTFKNYTKDSFQFFIEDGIITLTGPSFYPSVLIEVRKIWPEEIFANSFERTLVYKDGNFHYTNIFPSQGVRVTSAICRTL